MTEILTESFCERCGTRYTFQSHAPRHRRIRGLKTLSKGLRNFVLSDETSLEDALADAKNDEDREQSSQQLEAFHQTFNFCMTCRQYTCANCWNEAENRCLTCAPDVAREVQPLPFPELSAPSASPFRFGDGDGGRIPAAEAPGPDAWPEVDLSRLDSLIGQPPAASTPAPDIVTPPPAAEAPPVAAGLESEPQAAAAAEASIETVAAASAEVPSAGPGGPLAWPYEVGLVVPHPSAEPVTEALAPSPSEEPAPIVPVPDQTFASPVPEPTTNGTGIAAEAPEPVIEEAPEPAAEPGPAVTGPERVLAAPDVPSPQDRAAAAAAATSALFQKFRPGQSIDAELEAFEQAQGADESAVEVPPAAPEALAAAAIIAESEPEPVAAEPEPVAAEPETMGVPVEEPQPEPVAAQAEPPAPQPEPVAATAPEPPAPAPPAAEPEAPPPSAAPVGPPPSKDDRVEIPTWTIVAPEAEPVAPTPEAPRAAPGAPVQWPPTSAQATPPGGPSWPAAVFNRSGAPTSNGADALWAASSANLADRPGVKPCVSCGLSLSATARFCRRCGSPQA